MALTNEEKIEAIDRLIARFKRGAENLKKISKEKKEQATNKNSSYAIEKAFQVAYDETCMVIEAFEHYRLLLKFNEMKHHREVDDEEDGEENG